MYGCALIHVQLFVTLSTIVCQASLSIEFSRQEGWSALPFPSPGDISDRRIEPASPDDPALAGYCFITKPLLEVQDM